MMKSGKFADLHTHTILCGHAAGQPEEFLDAAIAKGLKYYGISDHLPCPDGFDQESRMMMLQYPEYRQIVADMKKRAEGSGTEVLYSCEMDYVPGRMREVADFVIPEHYDYIIGSIHTVNGFLVDHPDYTPRFLECGVDFMWNMYFDMLCEFVTGFPFHILGHADLLKVFGYRHSDSAVVNQRMYSVFELCAEKNIMVEINTAGWRKPVGEQYPSFELLKLAHQCGCSITLGSDAHKPEQIAADFDKAVELAEAAGFSCAYAFKNGNPIEMPFH